jgi:hypothetical protein
MIKAYAHEIIDGLEDAIKNSGSIAYTSTIDITDAKHGLDQWLANHNSSIATNINQEDLFYLKSVLVSTGWNLNDDIFTPAELWGARKTPEDKQFNFMHNDAEIIGHITSNEVFDFNGVAIADDLESPPEEFNIVTNAVIYRTWSNPEQKDKIEKIIAEIKEGKWFVSMECFFPSFDYALMNSAGELRIVERNEASAFLTKHLRTYGGSGAYQDFKIGRVLKSLVFSGKGLVDKPANPRSVILKDETISYANTNQEIDMTVEISKELEQVKAELIDTKAELLNAQSAIQSLNTVKAEVESLKSEISLKEETVASLTAEKTTLEETIASLKASLEASEAARKELDDKFKKIEAEARASKRKSQLAEAGVESDDLDDALASFESLEDATFEKMVAVMKKKNYKKPEMDTEEEDEEEDSAANVLDDATVVDEATANLHGDEEDPAAKLRATAVNFFSNTLATVKKNNQ